MIRPDLLIYQPRPAEDRIRRIIDAAIAGAALVCVSPVLAVAVLAILIEDGRPVLFTQRRVGRLGKTFVIYKLRTMRSNASVDALSPRSAADWRITRVGKILRKTSVDELPQLVNIVLGDMALVGPRPEMPFVVRSYQPWQHLRHLVTPGLTGLWQVEARKTIALEKPEATLIDLRYIQNRSPLFDLKILFRTVQSVIRPKGAF